VNFAFNQGVLTVACVSKASELLGAVDIPLAISRSLVELPGSILKVRIDQATKSAALIDAETQLLTIQKAQIAALQSGKYTPQYTQSKQVAEVTPFGVTDYSKTNLALGTNAADAGFLPPPPARPFSKESGCPGANG
jgi:hypothetical protein